MKNDIELTIKILKEIEAKSDDHPRLIAVPGYDETLVCRHIERLLDDGVIDGTKHKAYNRNVRVLVSDMTTSGHNFLAAITKVGVWEKIKSELSSAEISALSLRRLGGLAVEILETIAKKKLGLD